MAGALLTGRVTNVFYSGISSAQQLAIYKRACEYALATQQTEQLLPRVAHVRTWLARWQVPVAEQREILRLTVQLAQGNE